MILSTGPNDELLDTVWISRAAWILWGKPFVVMVMTIQHDISASCIQVFPECIVTRNTSMFAGGEAWVMPIGKCTGIGMSCEIGFQPLLLRRTDATTTHLATIRVEGNEVPGTNIIAVITFGWVTSCSTKVIVVTTRTT